MRIHPINELPSTIILGRQTETGVNEVRLDCAEWLALWPDLSISIWVTPPGGAATYPAQTHMEGDVLVWPVTDADTAKAGSGTMEVMGVADGQRKLSAIATTRVLATTTTTHGEVPNAPPKAIYAPMPNAPNQQLVTDDEGRVVWVPRVEEETVKIVILDETELVDDSGTFLLLSPWDEEVEAGSKYTVNYNGTPYELEAILYDFEGQMVPALGNLSLSGGTGGDENAPFCLVCIPVNLGAQIGVYGILKTGDSLSAVVVSVTGEVMPDTSGPIFEVRVPISYTTENGVEFGEADKTWPEVEKAHNAGKIIRVIGTMSDSYELSEYIGDIKAAHRANDTLALGFEMYTNLYMNAQGRVTRLMYGGDGGKIVFAVPD